MGKIIVKYILYFKWKIPMLHFTAVYDTNNVYNTNNAFFISNKTYDTVL